MKLLVLKKELRIISEPDVVFTQKYAVNFEDGCNNAELGIDELILQDKECDEVRGYYTLSVKFKVIDVSDDDFVKFDL